MKKKVDAEDYDKLCDTLYLLAEVLDAVGVTELKISKLERGIFWDTEGGGMVDKKKIVKLSSEIENLFTQFNSEE